MCQDGGGGSFLWVWSLCFLVRVLPLRGLGPGTPWTPWSSLLSGWILQQGLIDPCLGQSPPPALGEFHDTSGESTGCQLLPGRRSVGFALWPAAPVQVRAGEKYKPGGREATGSSDSVGHRRAGAEELCPGLKEGHTRANLSGLDGRPHCWASHPYSIIPLAHPRLCSAPSHAVRLLALRLNPRDHGCNVCAHLCTDALWRGANGTVFREPGAVCDGSQDRDLGL